VLVNGGPGLSVVVDGVIDTVIGFAFDDGRISRIFAVRNPAKLNHLAEHTPLSR
jgi:RNA polymerase sigma-70 factor (ECF subfamily)